MLNACGPTSAYTRCYVAVTCAQKTNASYMWYCGHNVSSAQSWSLDVMCMPHVCVNICDDCQTSATFVELALGDRLRVLHSEMHFHDRKHHRNVEFM